MTTNFTHAGAATAAVAWGSAAAVEDDVPCATTEANCCLLSSVIVDPLAQRWLTLSCTVNQAIAR